MAGSKKRNVKSIVDPTSREITSLNPNSREIKSINDPNSYYELYPSWRFYSCDTMKWCLDKANAYDDFWDLLLPKMKEFEQRKWKDILNQDRKKNHSNPTKNMNKCARDRIAQLHIEAEALVSLRFNGTYRFYGLIEKGVYKIVWFDKDHGDNEDCVYRSRKK